MSRITISFTRHDSDVVQKIKEIPDRDRSHVIVKILRQFWFSTEMPSASDTLSAPAEPTPTPKPVPTEADRQRFRERFGAKLPKTSSQQV